MAHIIAIILFTFLFTFLMVTFSYAIINRRKVETNYQVESKSKE